MSNPNDPNDPSYDWNRVDSDWVAEHRPDKLNEHHRERLVAKHGERRGTDMFVGALNTMLRRVRIVPPYRDKGRK